MHHGADPSRAVGSWLPEKARQRYERVKLEPKLPAYGRWGRYNEEIGKEVVRELKQLAGRVPVWEYKPE